MTKRFDELNKYDNYMCLLQYINLAYRYKYSLYKYCFAILRSKTKKDKFVLTGTGW